MNDAKRAAARAALEEVPKRDGIVVGLGSGSTAHMFVEELGALVRAGLRISGVPTSESTRALAQSVGIPLLSDDGPWDLELCVDGADEVSEALDLIKGGGAAHTREKIVNYASKRNVIIVDESKLSRQLGERWSVPIEVLPFAHLTTRENLSRLGNPVLRRKDGAVVRTDSGNVIYDLDTGPIEDAGDLDAELHIIPGVVETGLFVGRADVVLVAGSDGVRRLTNDA
ncbi:MAG: ribose-5-phosphate isomerase RpiA [Polyangiales bacterium]